VIARLVGAEGSLLVPFHCDGRLWKKSSSRPRRREAQPTNLLRQLISLGRSAKAHHSPAIKPPGRATEEAGGPCGSIADSACCWVRPSVRTSGPWPQPPVGRLYVFGLPARA